MEMLITVGIIGVLAVLIFPATKSLISKAHLAKCQNNLRQITAAGLAYVSDNNGAFPVSDENPWKVGGTFSTDSGPDDRDLNAYTSYNYKLFICPADRGQYKPPGGPAWSEKPYYQTFGTSYFYNAYAGSKKNITAGKESFGLAHKKISYIREPAKMVFFGDQDAVRATSGAQYKIVSLYWHATTNKPLMANMTFVDGSMRLVNVIDEYKKTYIFYNEDVPLGESAL